MVASVFVSSFLDSARDGRRGRGSDRDNNRVSRRLRLCIVARRC